MFYPCRTKRGPSDSPSSLSVALHTLVESPPPPLTFESKCQGRSFVGCYTYTFERKLDCTFVHTCTSDVAFYAEFSIEKHRRSCYHHLNSIGVKNQPREEMKRSLLISSSSWSDLFKQGMQKLTQCRVSICRASIESLDICIALL